VGVEPGRLGEAGARLGVVAVRAHEPASLLPLAELDERVDLEEGVVGERVRQTLDLPRVEGRGIDVNPRRCHRYSLPRVRAENSRWTSREPVGGGAGRCGSPPGPSMSRATCSSDWKMNTLGFRRLPILRSRRAMARRMRSE